MADVPEDLVARRVEQRVQGDRDLDRAEVRAEVTADLTDGVDDVAADLVRDLHQLVLRESMEVLRLFDVLEQVGHIVESQLGFGAR